MTQVERHKANYDQASFRIIRREILTQDTKIAYNWML